MTAPYAVAFVRDLSPKFSEAALTSHDNSQSPINMALAHEQHEKYVEAVRKFVPNVNTVPASETLPDCCFIEDTCVIVSNIAVITRPGHDARRGEVEQVKKSLESYPSPKKFLVLLMPEPCLLDGGDVLYTGMDMFVGLSKRTNQQGGEFLRRVFFEESGLCPVHIINLQNSASASTLHLKCVVSALTDNVLIVSDDAPGQFVQSEMERLVAEYHQKSESGYSFVKVPDQVASNILRFPDGEGGLQGIVFQKGFPKSRAIVEDAIKTLMPGTGCEIVELDMSQFILADGALTCCSLIAV
ncbi:N(G),N(G)-dimethylarginine dimethylaminohydrolase 1 [Podila minutissima]|uniref:N(G),N(G)-dimethylarginine dimethylaminohydrolase 1 n=1 Tax=Podila minutissima TaxID=64525 RepID=A0A9P5SEF7_9FUNG|nr:N(G),N(G)-dimethylarginine dimethylaminohydrolase 1 [Podila minutissima]